jgi:hypothetical protein
MVFPLHYGSESLFTPETAKFKSLHYCHFLDKICSIMAGVVGFCVRNNAILK